MNIAELYSSKEIISRYFQIAISNNQRKAVKEWLQLLHDNKLEKERENYRNFSDIILRDLLNYPEEELRKGFEKENVEFSFKDKEGNTKVLFEAKGTKTKELDQRQDYGKKEQETPVIQTLNYMARIPSKFGVTTNYRKFWLLDSTVGDKKCHKFDFYDMENNDEKIREFIGIFSYEKLVLENDKEELYDATITEEKEFTDEFYKLFHETRLMLIKTFQENDNVSLTDAIYYTQLFLNRLIFIFFVEDRGFISDNRLFSNRILKLLDSDQSTEHSKKVYAEITELFVAFDKGDKDLGVFGFNGGLFSGVFPDKISFSDRKDPNFFSNERRHSKLLKSTKLNEKDSKIINKQKQLNPIISNLLLMDSFNFAPQTTSHKTEAPREVSVNILGHIFEQSISDLEELKNEGVSRRKKEGVFYTPESITEYICKNTIIPYLSKSNVSTVHELINEYFDKIEELENRFSKIKILDPACGSGAFLVKAIDVLLEIHKEIQIVKESAGKYSTGGQFQLTKWNEEDEIRRIIEQNIYGVDINRESIEITQLSLFLKLASNHRKLSGLSKNIKVGNSLINEKDVDERSFDWNKEFPEILDPLINDNGFDIVIGNPPYVFAREKIDVKQKAFFLKNYETSEYQLNTYILFIERSIKLLKHEGALGFIIPDAWLKVESAKKLRKFMLENTYLEKIVNIRGETFPGVSVESCVFVLKNTQQVEKTKACTDLQKLNYSSFSQTDWLKNKNFEIELFSNKKAKNILDKITLNTKLLNEVSEIKAGLQAYEKGKGNPKQTKEDVKNRPYDYEHKFDQNTFKYLEGKDIGRYNFEGKEKWLRYGEWLAARRSFNLFSSPRLLVREIPANPPHAIVSTYIEEVYLNNRSIINILQKDKNLNLKYILAVLNSKLMTFYHLNKSVKAQREIFPKITLNDLRKFPMKILSFENQKPFIKKVDRIIFLNEELLSKKTKFVNRVLQNFNLKKLSNQLQNFDELNFNQFIDELKKQKATLTLEKQDEWETYFEEKKKTMPDLK